MSIILEQEHVYKSYYFSIMTTLSIVLLFDKFLCCIEGLPHIDGSLSVILYGRWLVDNSNIKY